MNCPKCEMSVTDSDCFCEECGYKLKESLSSPVSNTSRRNTHTEVAPDSKLALVSDIGRKHKSNQDTGTVARCGNGNIILVVADGVSSSINATTASETAVKVVSDTLLAYDNTADIEKTMQIAIQSAHEAIVALPNKSHNINIDSPETTIIAAIKINNQITIGWVGDSRAYLITDGDEEKLTIDDSWVEEVVQEGELTREQALIDKRSHYITQVLGMTDDIIHIHVISREIPSNSAILLCSDGLWNYLPDDGNIAAKLHECKSKTEALSICNYLVQYANEQGGHDNITVALLIR